MKELLREEDASQFNDRVRRVETISPLENYIRAIENFKDFSGRSTRSEYWWFVLMNILIFMATNVFDLFFDFPLFAILIALLLIIPSAAISVRRCHDVGQSGLLALIPFVSWLFLASPGDCHSNKYGEARDVEITLANLTEK